jgi:hypothetical protein
MSSLEDKAAEYLLMKGWTVLRPQPEIQVFSAGQVWVSPIKRIKPRKITKIGPHESASPNVAFVYFEVIGDTRPGSDGLGCMRRKRWRDWVRAAKAELQEEEKTP